MHGLPPRGELKENVGAVANRRALADGARQFGKEICNEKEEPPAALGCPEPRSAAAHAARELQHCRPYAGEILQYLFAAEQADCPPRDYFARQTHVNEHMRAVLVDWLVDVAQKFKLQPQSSFLAVDLLDRHLAAHAPARSELQLIGVCCLMIVAKYEEIYPPLLADFLAVCDGAYTREQLLAAESAVLLASRFELNRPTALTFLEYFQTAFNVPERPLHYCHYLLESALLDCARLDHAHSALAAGAFFLICKLFKECSWTAEHERVSGVSAARAKACARELYLIMQRNDRLRLTAVKRKFAAPRYCEVARFKIEKVAQD